MLAQFNLTHEDGVTLFDYGPCFDVHCILSTWVEVVFGSLNTPQFVLCSVCGGNTGT